MSKKRSLSGIKPTGFPHLGNYLGMIRPAIDLQDEYEAYYFAADYHALTTARDPKAMRASVYELTSYFLAFGLDPEKSAFFRQSDIPEVCELTWLLSCVTHMGLLERAHAYKAADAEGRGKEISHGLFSYPVLMAADILIYDSDIVPVGQDQIQHLEMTRDMAQKFNAAFNVDALKLPVAKVQENVATVPGTDGRKMSKSYGNLIEPLLPPKKLRKQCMAIATDSTPLEDPKDPDTCNVFTLYKLFATPSELEDMRQNYLGGGYGYGHAKQALFEKLDAYFSPYREEYQRLRADEAYLEEVLQSGAERVRPAVEEVMDRVRRATGIGRR
ncbi:tryptophan--tRNA ligase [Bradymonas sediminis]|uniref:Tryptophan--tRNA ligase n=1 Tax=Bradymonas sediminis TaxID=1548548 RepID=A0A2Z4FLI9_9DELT|nr:tryptophan--tRNA ligase [Bradymonas sediminis]AWV89690.1 tryptophan--tRNA ligase [Bradymonas sediminis]TDP76569.1 tryptophanyl-tRNA synthetase [Bradymonas sediminis]